MDDVHFLLAVVNLLILLAVIAVFGLSLKLYTEYAKDRLQDRRQGRRDDGRKHDG